jgi:glycosyltransferase involved in cell wall biosynthesis
MKVIHINAHDSGGGAAIAAYRHCEAMYRAGIDSKMLVLIRRDIDKPLVRSYYRKAILGKFLVTLSSCIMGRLLQPFHPKVEFNIPLLTPDVASHPLVKDADMIYIHWVGAKMLSAHDVERILKLGKPVRWYMHDMNPITGGCYYSLDCEKYKTSCENCPNLKCHYGIDLAKIQFSQRIKHWNKYSNLEAYTPSRWLGNLVRQSAIWKGHKVTVFPNVLDIDKFHPCSKVSAREIFGLRKDRKVVLFGACGLNYPLKGWKYMKEALNRLDPDIYEGLILGASSANDNSDLRISCKFTGFLKDEYSLILAYNAANVFVSSSLADNYPNVVMEAMACGLPCVAFRFGGLQDQIRHKENGFLATYKDSGSLAEGIQFVCQSSEEEYANMQQAARRFVCEVGSYDVYRNFQ